MIGRDEWNEEKARQYVEFGWWKCPFCESEDLTLGSIEGDGNIAWQSVYCDDCGAEWNDIYKLTDIKVTSFGSSEVVLPGREN